MMPVQRTRDAESRVRNKLSNGPLRVQSNARRRRVVLQRAAYVSCRGYAGILLRAREFPRESRWHRGLKRFVLDKT